MGLNEGSSATLTNCVATANTVAGTNNIGGLVGLNISGAIARSHVYGNKKGKISGTRNIAGLVGKNVKASIESSSVDGISASGTEQIGGLIGLNDGGERIKCCRISKVKVYGKVKEVGGLIGRSEKSKVENCRVLDSEIIGDNTKGNWYCCDYLGGLVGVNLRTNIVEASVEHSKILSQCTYFVAGGSYLGGIVGISFDSNISKCFVGKGVEVDGGNLIGGIAGSFGGGGSTISQSYSQAKCGNKGTERECGSLGVGGIAGYIRGKKDCESLSDKYAHVNECYFAGSVYRDPDYPSYNGLVGYDVYRVKPSYSFWSVKSKHDTWGETSRKVSEDKLQSKELYIGAGWDTDVWSFTEEGEELKYPTLQWAESDSSFSDSLAAGNLYL